MRQTNQIGNRLDGSSSSNNNKRNARLGNRHNRALIVFATFVAISIWMTMVLHHQAANENNKSSARSGGGDFRPPSSILTEDNNVMTFPRQHQTQRAAMAETSPHPPLHRDAKRPITDGLLVRQVSPTPAKGDGAIGSEVGDTHSIQNKTKQRRPGTNNHSRHHLPDPTSTKPNVPKQQKCSSGPPLSAALVLFGVPKKFEKIWKAYINQIVKRNLHIKFETHMHIYSDLKKLTNVKNNEVDAIIESPAGIQRILELENITSKLVTSSQSEYDNSLGWVQKEDLHSFDPCCWTVDTVKNMFRQGNSLKQAFLSALNAVNTSQKGQYDIYFFLRSDTLLLSPIAIPCTGLPSHQLDLPSWQVFRNEEYVDRFAISGKAAAFIYAKAKADVFPEILLDRRGKNALVWAAKPPKGKHDNSERLLRLWLDANPQIDVKRGDQNWAKLLRIRAGGEINKRDANTFRVSAKNINDLQI